MTLTSTLTLTLTLTLALALILTLTLTLTQTLKKLGWHISQAMPNLKLSMGDSILHSVSVVAVVNERQG